MSYNVFISPSSLRVIPVRWLPFRVVSFQAYIPPRFMANENAIRLLLQGILCSSLFPPEAADSINRRWKLTCNRVNLFERKRNCLFVCVFYVQVLGNFKVFKAWEKKKFNLRLLFLNREEKLSVKNVSEEGTLTLFSFKLEILLIYNNLTRKVFRKKENNYQ